MNAAERDVLLTRVELGQTTLVAEVYDDPGLLSRLGWELFDRLVRSKKFSVGIKLPIVGRVTLADLAGVFEELFMVKFLGRRPAGEMP
jgi:hypothetical protein